LHAVDVDDAAAAVTAGFALGQYRFDKYRSEPKPAATERLTLIDADAAARDAADRALTIAEGVAIARNLVNEPPVGKPATGMADLARTAGEAVGLRVVIHDEEALVAGGFGGLLGVAAGAHNPARLVEMWHEPEGAEAFLAVVGKGIVFDSGGLSLKPPNAMEDMKTDMAGAAAVIGAMRTIAALGLPVKVVGITPLTENMPGGGATRPGDVLTIRNGKTIEVLNTDAEGRLVLADGLSLATESEPDLIVDLATLTGACHIALGDGIAGMFGNDDAAMDAVQAAADRAGERVWPMPLPADYRSQIDSEVADMKNVGERWGGAITAALLLAEFVDDTPWVHLDIAGPARATKTDGYITSGGTGFGVRTIVALAEDMASG
jgi:leucyl aminopeptidase